MHSHEQALLVISAVSMIATQRASLQELNVVVTVAAVVAVVIAAVVVVAAAAAVTVA